MSTFFSQLQFFKERYKNDIISEQKAAILLSKYFNDSEYNLRNCINILKDFTISNELLNYKTTKSYATPGADDLSINLYSCLMKFLNYGFRSKQKCSNLSNTQNKEFTNEVMGNYATLNRYKENWNRFQEQTQSNYSSIREDTLKGTNKRSVASVGFSNPRNPISSLKWAGRMEIEKRIHLDNLK